MKKLYIITIVLVSFFCASAKESINPSVSPALFRYNTTITVTYDVTGTPLASLGSAYIWVWIPGKDINAKYNVNPASSDVSKTNNAKFVKSVVDGKTLFTITFMPSAFFDGDISAETQMGMLLKGNDWANGQTTDYITTFWDGTFQVKLLSPTQRPLFVSNGEQISIQAETPVAADYDLLVNDVLVDEQNSSTNYSYVHTVGETSGSAVVKIVATNGGNTEETSFQYVISTSSTVQPRPAGIIPGINYNADHTKATLCLWAPGKSSVYVIGDFTDWEIQSDYLMKKDGEYFWIEITGLTSGQEYGFQYLIDESIYVADPYADKILDPNDQYIPSTTYPGLKTYPQKALHTEWYFNRVSVLQTNQETYDWMVTDFVKPEKEKLVIYELLVRDFFDDGNRNYQNLIDTLGYLKKLGINALELMPVMEFNGNESWGYNPTFMFAPDKYYGTKNKLKELIDKCHQQGIAVILDIVMNHQDMPNTYVMMDFDFIGYKPTPSNKWFNVSARHPFNVFYDMNHESSYTKSYLDTVNYYWLKEFNVDGFRFDLSKGFTQQNNPNNVDAWSAYDASRIAILKRMADKIWQHSPNAYVILEHLSVNSEEKELAEYRAGEGKGMMLWGKMTEQFNQNTMGYSENSDISGTYHSSRSWSVPRLVSYMESHDEERLMYKNIQFGKTANGYDTKSVNTALARMRAAATIFYTVPGPKMLWQFGELGYDYSINHCEDGTVNSDCRISPKPVRWDYYDEGHRKLLYDHIGELNHLRENYDVFTNGTATFVGGTSLVKQITLKNEPYTANPTLPTDMNAVVVANFDLQTKSTPVSFPHTGTWYDFYGNGEAFEVSGVSATVELTAGQYKIYTDVAIEPSIITSVGEKRQLAVSLYPNPVGEVLTIESKDNQISNIVMFSMQGAVFTPRRLSPDTWNMHEFSKGLYIVEVRTRNGIQRVKIFKQ